MVFKSSAVKKNKISPLLHTSFAQPFFVFTLCLSPEEIVVGAEC